MNIGTYINSVFLDGFLIIEPALLGYWYTYCKNITFDKFGLRKISLTIKIIKDLETVNIEDYVKTIVDNKVDNLDGFREGIFFSNKREEFIRIYRAYVDGNII